MRTIEDWLDGNKLGIDIWNKKYCQFRKSLERKENFEEWLDRVSGGNEDIKQLILDKKFLFGGRILANRGMEKEGRKITYSNCYVLDTGDSLEQIYQTASDMARTYSYGGGVGVDLSPLRPEGAKVNNAAASTTGPLSFAEIFEKTTEVIGQQGRRGALMLSISSEHPDVEKFITIKQDLDKITHANLSVRFTDNFLGDASKKRSHKCAFMAFSSDGSEYITRQVDADKVLSLLAECNWNTGEPGALFWDRITGWNLLSEHPGFNYAGVNPCAEEPLPAGGSCLLGSINLAEYAIDGEFDFKSFKKDVKIAVTGLNEVLFEGLPLHPLAIQRECVSQWRQIGLGIMGLADCLIKLGIPYGSQASLDLCDKIGKTMINAAVSQSAKLTEEYGTFPSAIPLGEKRDILHSNFAKYTLTKETIEKIKKYGGIVNSQLLTTAPTGTLSTMLGISGGIEPIFANYYYRTTKSLSENGDEVYKVYTPIVKEYMEQNNITDDSQLPNFFITARDIEPIQRIKMQGTWQQYIDASISSTINLPEETTPEEIKNIYMQAWAYGLKGITVFRENCARVAILNTNAEPKAEDNVLDAEAEHIRPEEINDDVIGKKRRLTTGCGSLHCQAYFDPNTGALREVFLSKGSQGGCQNFMVGLSRMTSLAARSGVSIDDIIDQLNSAGVCPSYHTRSAIYHDTSKGSCCPTAVGYALKDMYNEMQEELRSGEHKTKQVMKPEVEINEKSKCPQCGEPLVHEGGCDICKACGWSKCQ